MTFPSTSTKEWHINFKKKQLWIGPLVYTTLGWAISSLLFSFAYATHTCEPANNETANEVSENYISNSEFMLSMYKNILIIADESKKIGVNKVYINIDDIYNNVSNQAFITRQDREAYYTFLSSPEFINKFVDQLNADGYSADRFGKDIILK